MSLCAYVHTCECRYTPLYIRIIFGCILLYTHDDTLPDTVAETHVVLCVHDNYLYIYIQKYVSLFTCVYDLKVMYVHTLLNMYVHKQIHLHVHKSMYFCMYLHMHMHKFMHMYTRTPAHLLPYDWSTDMHVPATSLVLWLVAARWRALLRTWRPGWQWR